MQRRSMGSPLLLDLIAKTDINENKTNPSIVAQHTNCDSS